MLKIEYEIQLNESGRPCIDLAMDYVDKEEDKFLVIELARYLLQNVYNKKNSEFNEEEASIMDSSIQLLGQIGDKMAEIIFNDMKQNAEIAMLVNESGYNAHIWLKSIKERDELGFGWICYENKIFKRKTGFRVMVYDEKDKDASGIYELIDGITNEHWVKIIEKKGMYNEF